MAVRKIYMINGAMSIEGCKLSWARTESLGMSICRTNRHISLTGTEIGKDTSQPRHISLLERFHPVCSPSAERWNPTPVMLVT